MKLSLFKLSSICSFLICMGFINATTIPFSPYKDVTVGFNSNSNVISTRVNVPADQTLPNSLLSTLDKSVTTVTWGFATGECGQEQWGWLQPSVTSTFASTNVNGFNAAGEKYIIATGGAAGAFTCGSDTGMKTFVDRYNSSNLVGLDFDIEGNLYYPYNPELVQSLINEIAYIHTVYPNLKISFTLGTNAGVTTYPGESAPFGVSDLGALVLNDLAALSPDKSFPYNVNLMVMDYGFPANTTPNLLSDICAVKSTDSTVCDMGQSAVQAAKNLHNAYNIPYNHIELTPMIGKNDNQAQIFTEDDVTTLANFAVENNLAEVHMWSFDRDTGDCYSPTQDGHANPTCSQLQQEPMAFQKDFVKALTQ